MVDRNSLNTSQDLEYEQFKYRLELSLSQLRKSTIFTNVADLFSKTAKWCLFAVKDTDPERFTRMYKQKEFSKGRRKTIVTRTDASSLTSPRTPSSPIHRRVNSPVSFKIASTVDLDVFYMALHS